MKNKDVFQEFADVFMEDWLKYGRICEEGYLWLDDGVVKGKVGQIKYKKEVQK